MEENIDTIIAKYGQKVPKKPHKGLVVIISVIIILIVAATAVGMLFLLQHKTTKTSTPSTSSTAQTFNGPTAKEIIDKVAVDPTVNDTKNYFLFRTGTAQPDPSSDISSVIYAESGYNFVTNVTAQDGLRLTRVSTKAASNKAAIATTVTNILIGNGFTVSSQDTAVLSSYKVVTYVNNGTVCQIVDYTGANQTILEQGVLCIDHTGLEKGYKNVQTLLAKAGATLATDAKSVNQTTVTDGTKTLLTLTVQPKTSGSTTTKYYFATLATDYEYIGSQPTPSVDNASSYTLSDQLKKNSADPKWGTFLSDNIK